MMRTAADLRGRQGAEMLVLNASVKSEQNLSRLPPACDFSTF